MRSYKRGFVAQPEGTPRFQSELCRGEHVECSQTAQLESPVPSPRCCLVLLTGMLPVLGDNLKWKLGSSVLHPGC